MPVSVSRKATAVNSPYSVGSARTSTRSTSFSVPAPVLDQVGDGDHLQPVPLAVRDEVGHAGHRAVVVHDLADDAGRVEAGEPREVDGGLGLAGALEHAARRARSGKTWPGWTRSCGVDSGSIATWIVCARSAAEMPVVTPSRASIETVNAVP